MVTREKRLNILISDEEHSKLWMLAERAGLTPSDYVRQFIRAEYERLHIMRPVAQPKPIPRVADAKRKRRK